MMELSEKLLQFIQEELGVESYSDPMEPFADHAIESFQVLEVILEMERQLGVRMSFEDFTPESLYSLKGLIRSATS